MKAQFLKRAAVVALLLLMGILTLTFYSFGNFKKINDASYAASVDCTSWTLPATTFYQYVKTQWQQSDTTKDLRFIKYQNLMVSLDPVARVGLYRAGAASGWFLLNEDYLVHQSGEYIDVQAAKSQDIFKALPLLVSPLSSLITLGFKDGHVVAVRTPDPAEPSEACTVINRKADCGKKYLSVIEFDNAFAPIQKVCIQGKEIEARIAKLVERTKFWCSVDVLKPQVRIELPVICPHVL